MRLITLLAAAPLLVGARLPAQANEHTFYNKAHTSFATRSTTTDGDKIFFTAPPLFRHNAPKASGWRLVIQDENQATAEEVFLSWHPLENDDLTPKMPEILAQKVTCFGVGVGPEAYLFSFTTQNPIDLPEFHAMCVHLPAPHPYPTDVTTLHYQRGDHTKVKPENRQQVTYDLFNNAVRDRWVIGSVFHWGGLFVGPVTAMFNRSTAYGPSEDLYGPEATRPDPTRGDKIGWFFSGDRYESFSTQFPSAVAAFGSAGYRDPVFPTPLGPFVLADPWFLLVVALLDQDGNAMLGPVPIPNTPTTFALQGGFVNFHSHLKEFSNGTQVKI